MRQRWDGLASGRNLGWVVSVPFAPGPHRRVAVKVIDPRGNEVMAVHRLGEKAGYGMTTDMSVM